MSRFSWKILGLATCLVALISSTDPARGNGMCCDSPSVCDSGCWSCGDANLRGGACGCGGGSCNSSMCGDQCINRLTRHLDRCGWIQKSDRCFDDFISPMINFVFFEDPRNLTELRPIFVSQSIPNTIGSGISAGGSAQLFALHIRAALTDRLSLIAVKDGYIIDNTNGTLDTLLDDGWAAVSLGLKYNLLRDVCRGTLLSTGFTYELPVGSRRALQDIGDGEFHFFGSGGQRFLDGNAHWLTSLGFRLPVDNDLQTTSVHWSNHFDVRVTDRAYVFTEVAWWHWTEEAPAGQPIGVAGQDLFNLSASNVDGNDLVTQNVGVKYKPRRNMEAGFAYEFPLTEFKDIIDDRVTLDFIVRY